MKNWKYIVWAFFVLLGTACEEIALPATALIVQENKADVLYTSATLTIKLEPTAATIQAMNVYYSLSSNMSDSQKMAMKKVDASTYTAVLVNLKEETTYYVQYEALNAFSSTKDKNTYDFKTKKQVILPTVVTSTVTQITVSSAVMGGNITSDGGATVTERGVVYSTSQNPDINDINNFICPCGSGTGEFTYTATTLKSNTTYYVRAYAKNEKGTAYGEQVSFTTAEAISETPVYVDLGLPSGIKWADRNVGATKPWEYGDHFAWGETSTKDNYSEETYSHVKVIRGNYVIAKYKGSDYSILLAEDDAATAKWGGEWRMPTKEERDELYEYCNWEWTTKNGVEGYKVTSKQNGNSIFLPLAGCIDGDWTNTAYGFYWTSTVNTENTWNAYDINFTSSSVLMNDDVRVYGRSVRPVYGPRAAVMPVVVTSAVTQITENSAVLGGNVMYDGNATVTERGVVYSTSPNPVITNLNNFIRPCGSGTGEFTYNATTLQANTTYYVRAYAKNEKGTAYGAEVSFTTNNQVVVPTVTTTAATQVTETTAVTGGNVTSDGGASVTERGVVYSTSRNPTTSNSKVKNGSGTGYFTCNLTGLQANTTYYVRAYAVNSKGTSYGTEVSFTTKSSSSSDHTGTENGHEYVDLGLSVKWATCNVGANKPEDYGDHFAWGETTTKSVYGWSTYNWCNGTSSTLTKYNTSNIYGTVDQKTKLELSDDAARVNWGGKWRMPTYDEFLELREKCTWKWTTQNGVKGYMITNNGNSMFLPAAGYRYESSLINAGSLGYYWSSSLETGIPYYAWYMELNSIMEEEGSHRGNRSAGRSVRPVCP